MRAGGRRRSPAGAQQGHREPPGEARRAHGASVQCSRRTRILDRSIVKELGPPFAIGVGVFTFFLVIDRIYQLTDLVITKNVPFALVMPLLLYMLPAFLALTLPMATLVAVLLVCGRLAGDLEVAALKASGVSPLRLFRPFLAAGVVVTLLIAWLTLMVGPWSSGAFQRQLFRILQSRASTGIKERTFSATFNQFVIYVDEVSPSQVRLKGLLVSDERNPDQSRIIVAREGRLLSDEATRRITLRFLDGSISESDVGDRRRFRQTYFSLYDMSLPVDSPLTAASKEEKPEKQLPLRQLIGEADRLRREGQIATPYYVELHKRFALPMAALMFTLVGFPLGIRSHRGGRAVALGLSFGIVVSYYILYTSMEGFALRGRLPAGIAVWVPNAILALVGLAMLRAEVAGVSTAWLDAFWRLWAKIGERRSGRVAKPLEERRRGRLGRLTGPRESTFIMDRYLIRQYLIYLGIGTVIGAVLIGVVDLLQTLDRFLRVKPPFTTILEHFVYRLPGELYKGLPMIVLIATVFLFLSLTRQRELDAFKAAGISLYRASLPILLVAGAISVLAVAFQEIVLPDINAKSEEVDRVKIRGQLPRHLQRQTQIWYRSSDTRFFRMALLDPAGKSMEGLTVLDISRDFRMEERLDARAAQWSAEGWQLTDGVFRRVGPQNRVTSEMFDSRLLAMPEHIDDFIQLQNAPDTMSFLELRAYVARLRDGGHRVTRYLVQLYSKLSFPLVHVIMALVAIPFALVSPRSGGRAMGIGVAIVIAVGYWVVHSIALAFAQADLLPAALAAWTANIVFAGIGTALFLSART
ncbi:MAG TPA: LPS export ABC transporter permease LptG [Candidatus Dormibacteraeota bacterium]|nr:LPS export ABC transporter permease LptG [Candidatus Dormibacteraeota bacterium]